MKVYLKFIFTYLIIIIKHDTTATMSVHKYINHKDMSEYCRRRVLPSVFLGRHVLDANSAILHFSRLELPYSCSVSVRAESGSNIILVIQFMSDNSLIRSCTEDNHQLLVYEIGETFGGYWGPLPDSIMGQDVNNFTQFYTLKTTEPITTNDYSSESESDEEETKEKTATPMSTQITKIITDSDYIEIEVPLVNVSGNILMDRVQPERVENVLEILNDVTPRKGVVYDSSILPLLQFSMLAPKDSIHSDVDADNFKFVSEYQPGIYTPDSRLIYGTRNRVTEFRSKNTVFANRRLNFKKRLSTLISKAKKTTVFRKKFYTHRFPITIKPYNSLHVSSTRSTVQRNDSSILLNNFTIRHMTKPQEIIDQIIKSLSHTTHASKTQNILVQSVLDTQQNLSAYLLTNTSVYRNENLQPHVQDENVLISFISPTVNKKEKTSINDYVDLKKATKSSMLLKTNVYTMKDGKKNSMTQKIVNKDIKHQETNLSDLNIRTFLNRTTTLSKISKTDDSLYMKVNMDFIEKRVLHNTYSTNLINNSKFVTGSMVNHESWENVVQAAPVMAVLLNQTLPPLGYTTDSSRNREFNEYDIEENLPDHKFLLKKRYVQPLEIQNAQPRSLNAIAGSFAAIKTAEDFVNVQDISHLVEFKDDEIQGRVALRYIRNYVGSALFNICDYREPKTRHVYLFNASRIVIAISNFTMDKMTLVMTPAHTLKSKEKSCPTAHLECQISGARVCIDSMSACDGVPNCGAYDIYDEDRLLCGVVSSLQHNVYLAACTFLALLLTLIYTIHYWLKRCVPMVSEAFFVYTDRSENILNLETIMQSPNDEDDTSKMLYGNFYYDDTLDVGTDENIKETMFKKMWKLCLPFCLKNKSLTKQLGEKDIDEESTLNNLCHTPVKRLFSFAQLELNKILPERGINANVQTGDSLELAYLNKIKDLKSKNKPLFNTEEFKKNRKEKEELHILKFLKETRSESTQSIAVYKSSKSLESINKNLHFNMAADEEKELLSTVYEPQSSGIHKHEPVRIVTRGEVYSEKNEQSFPKRLRFDEEATTIPSIHTDEDLIEGEENCFKSQVVLGTEKLRCSETIEDREEQGSSSGREFIRFWTGTKSKKPKKKKRVT